MGGGSGYSRRVEAIVETITLKWEGGDLTKDLLNIMTMGRQQRACSRTSYVQI